MKLTSFHRRYWASPVAFAKRHIMLGCRDKQHHSIAQGIVMRRVGVWLGLAAVALVLLGSSARMAFAQSTEGPFELEAPCIMTRAVQLPIEFEYQGTIPTGFDGINRATCRFTKAVETVTVTLSGPASHTELFTLGEPSAEVPFPLAEGTLSISTLEIVPPGEYEREMIVTSVDGEALVISDESFVLKTVTIIDPTVAPPTVGDFAPSAGLLAGTAALGMILVGFGAAVAGRRIRP